MRETCASACYSHLGKYHILTFKRNFNFLASLCSGGDWLEPHFVRNPEDRVCRVEAWAVTQENLPSGFQTTGCTQTSLRSYLDQVEYQNFA